MVRQWHCVEFAVSADTEVFPGGKFPCLRCVAAAEEPTVAEEIAAAEEVKREANKLWQEVREPLLGASRQSNALGSLGLPSLSASLDLWVGKSRRGC